MLACLKFSCVAVVTAAGAYQWRCRGYRGIGWRGPFQGVAERATTAITLAAATVCMDCWSDGSSAWENVESSG